MRSDRVRLVLIFIDAFMTFLFSQKRTNGNKDFGLSRVRKTFPSLFTSVIPADGRHVFYGVRATSFGTAIIVCICVLTFSICAAPRSSHLDPQCSRPVAESCGFDLRPYSAL